MKPSYPIKTDIFRFVTVRTPDHIHPQAKASRFIYHPDLSASILSKCPSEKEPRKDQFRAFLKQFQAVHTYEEIRRVNAGLYDAGDDLLGRSRNSYQNDEARQQLSALTDAQRLYVWDQLLYQVIAKASSYIRQACVRMLIADHALRHWGASAHSAMQYKVVIPMELLRCMRPWLFKDCAGELYGVNRLGIADFRRVEQEVCCYVPGEVSHIENVLAREYKERTTRNLVRSELTTEITAEVEIENLTDTTTATRNELSTEVTQVMNEQRSTNYGGSLGVSGEYMGVTIDANAYADFANANSSSHSNASAKLYAEELVKRALERIVQRTKEKRTSKIIKEFEENNKHGFDNRHGREHVTGIYRWVDIIYSNRLVNYGKRLMIEFLIPEPAEFFKRVLKYRPEEPSDTGGSGSTNEDGPKSLAELGINGPEDIDRDNYTGLATTYGISISPPKDATLTVSQAFSPTPPLQHNSTAWTQTFQIAIPPDYKADTLTGNYSFEYKAWGFAPDAYFNFDVGGISGGQTGLRSRRRDTKNGSISNTFATKHTVQVPVIFTGRQLYTYSANLVVHCKLQNSVYADWQTSAYNQLLTAYNGLISQGGGASEPGFEVGEEEGDFFGGSNPAFNRITEQRELKRACIELLAKPFCRVQGQDWTQDENACDQYDIPQVVQNQAFEAYASQVKFFEQAFEWSVMSYLFYPYYWADKCDWADLMQSEDIDLIFQAFKQAGMARVVVLVRPEFTEAVLFYMETGDIWLGGDLVVGTEDDLYLSIVDELATIEGEVEEEWQVRVPTSLAIVQQRSAALDEEGLPCCHGVENDETTTNILGSKNILEIIEPK